MRHCVFHSMQSVTSLFVLTLYLLQANTVYGALRGLEVCMMALLKPAIACICNHPFLFLQHFLEKIGKRVIVPSVMGFPSLTILSYDFQTFSQLCAFDYGTKSVQVYKAPWYILDKPRFPYRGLLLGRLHMSLESIFINLL